MKSAILGAVLLVAGAVLVATGVLPLADAAAVGQRVWPILLFVVAITVVTELAAEAELFRVVAERAAGWGRGRTWLLWLFVVLFAVLATVFLSLDTTAVLLTPVVILLARHVGLPPLPFALTTVWLANTASLLLPVSNLTNLLAQHALGNISPFAFVALMWAPALVAIVVPVVVLFLAHRRELTTRYVAEPGEPVADRVLLWASAAVVVLLLPSLVSGIPVWIPACAGALLLLLGFFAVRRRSALRFGLLPWQLVLLASGLFLVVEACHAIGATAVLGAIAGTGHGFVELLRMAGVGALAANLVDNLPAYLALEPSAGRDPVRLAALLIGVNAGPLITPWASLATLLWHQRLVAMNVSLSWWRYIALGAVVVPLTVTAAVAALWLAAR
ncbi:MAG: SLC13 family permease [Rhodoglobus sp.]